MADGVVPYLVVKKAEARNAELRNQCAYPTICMERKVVSAARRFRAVAYIIEKRGRSALALCNKTLLPHDVYEDRAVNYDQEFPRCRFAFTDGSLYGGYSPAAAASRER
jgi:hypothetical protein